jgi:septal ring factor EnvC (AmiA/AmiB activator)
MLRDRRFTLIFIPEEGGQTYEYKLARPAVWAVGAAAAAVLLFLTVGAWSTFKAVQLEQRVVRLEEENGLLQEEVAQIRQLEQVLGQLQRSNRQLRAILGDRARPTLEASRSERGAGRQQAASGLERLRWGRVHSVPSLWPLAGPLARPFASDFPAVLIAAPPRSLVRASAAGRIAQAEYDAQLGYVVVIDHGGGLLSTYGYNAMVLVETGQDIVGGQPVALSGRSGRNAVAGLYYAVTEGGVAQDPRRYRLWL